MLRSVGAVLAGFVTMAIIVMAGTVVLTMKLLPGGMAGMQSRDPATTPPRRYLVANLTLSLGAAVIGGWLTAAIAGTRPLTHAAVLGIWVLAMGMVSARQSGGRSGQPSWYPWVITGIGVAGVLVGGALRAQG